jgi:LAO/AO transport system kinase
MGSGVIDARFEAGVSAYMTPDPISDRVLAGDPRSIARAISIVEDDASGGAALIGRLYQHTGRAYLIGVTGAPGVGKSTLVDRLVTEARRRERTVGVLAVDPTSPYTGGAILGDRVRMSAHANDSGVFVRSMATRGHLGGLAAATSDAALVLDAAGKDVVIIETVGVGQDEVDIVRTADVTIVMLVPGAGDDVQALKAGIMEIADIFVVNKADREGADQVVQSVTASLSLQTFADGEWRPPVIKTEATTGLGVDRLWDEIERFRQHASQHQAQRRKASHETRLRGLLAQRLLEHVEKRLPSGEFERLVEAVAARRTDPYSAAASLMSQALDL